MSLKVLVLVDNRVGNSNQARALANLLKLDYEEIELEYNKLAFLPFLFKDGFKLLNKRSLDKLSDLTPDLIISSGRRAASIALAFKRRDRNCRILQILNPQKNFDHFDLVVLPEHDRKHSIQYPINVIFSQGAISYFSEEELVQESSEWQDILSKFKEPYIVVLIGGNSKKCKFKAKYTDEFISILLSIAKSHQGSLLITLSRRTPSCLVEKLIGQLEIVKAGYFIYDPRTNRENPYKAFIYRAEHIIVTGDSISMCSEACSLNKPVYIYARDGMLGKKHMAFVKNLFKTGSASPLTSEFKAFTATKNDFNCNLIQVIKEKLNI